MERILWKHNLNEEALKILSVIVADNEFDMLSLICMAVYFMN